MNNSSIAPELIAALYNADARQTCESIATQLHFSTNHVCGILRICRRRGIFVADKKAARLQLQMIDTLCGRLIFAMRYKCSNLTLADLAAMCGIGKQTARTCIRVAQDAGLDVSIDLSRRGPKEKQSSKKPKKPRTKKAVLAAEQPKKRYDHLTAPDILRVEIGRTWHRQPYTWSYSDIDGR